MFIVELEKGVWLDGSEGDPGRTVNRGSAQRFMSITSAKRALDAARKYRPFLSAEFHPAPKN